MGVTALELQARELPGHADDCLAFRTGDLLFTGDALLAGGIGSTRGAGGAQHLDRCSSACCASPTA